MLGYLAPSKHVVRLLTIPWAQGTKTRLSQQKLFFLGSFECLASFDMVASGRDILASEFDSD